MSSDLIRFKEYIKFVKQIQKATRDVLPFQSKARHFINENTLVRIDDELETIRGKRDWLKKTNTPGFDAYITMRVYRNSITHNGGCLNDQFYNKKLRSDRNRTQYLPNYEAFCRSCNDARIKILQPGDKLMLSIREPNFLLKLLKEVEKFARKVLT